ncbi:hypothetical protein [Gilvimarinus japonicus]|uniref:Gp5/Type VI secretion system Vgr protein OB-fold domain-containing protein n=1 Tax=Gilvimarinus japonicus TaxID=1796469 RepID=A0ABV7HRS6_9GAMM
MIEQIKRIIGNLYPEIRGGYHLPRFARVLSISDAPNDGGVTDNYRPRYAVNIQVLKENGKPDSALPVFNDLALPVLSVGMERGGFGFPQPGCLVEVAFAYGSPQRPFIRTVLSTDASMPEVAVGDDRQQTAPGIFEHTRANGDKSRTTFGDVTDTCHDYTLDAADIIQRAQSLTSELSGHSKENVGGLKLIEAMAAVKLLSGGFFRIVSVGHISLVSGGNLHEYLAGGKQTYAEEDIKAVTKKAMITECEKVETLAASAIRLNVKTDGKVYIGDDNVNVVKALADLTGIVKDLATKVANHVHPSVGAPTSTASQFTAKATEADALKSKVDLVAE